MTVEFSAAARLDLRDIYEYIAYVLGEASTAKKLAHNIIDAAESLDILSERGALYMHEPWQSLGLRYLTVKNYMIFYLADGKNGKVEIMRIIYGGRELSAQLDESIQ